MRRGTDRAVSIMLVLMGVITVVALTFCGILGALYIRERDKNEQLQAQGTEVPTEEATEVFAETDVTYTEDEVNALLSAKADETTGEIKKKMRELVTGEDASSVKMLRYFFPENLVYYDENDYAFADILDNVQKHTLVDENFRVNDDGEMEYTENGVVTSHKGIDVSKYQGEIDWEKVAADGVEYAFVRLGLRGYESGKLVLDDYFDDNMTNAASAGVKTGVYFFTQAITVEEAQEEAAFVIEHLAGHEVTCPVVFDVEMIVGGNGRANDLTMQERTDITIAFCEAVKAAGYTPMIYGNIKCFTKLLDLTQLEAYEKWYAFYDDYLYFPYALSVWQYSEKGTVDGIGEEVDLNISFQEW